MFSSHVTALRSHVVVHSHLNGSLEFSICGHSFLCYLYPSGYMDDLEKNLNKFFMFLKLFL